jgi:hypothetical protein
MKTLAWILLAMLWVHMVVHKFFVTVSDAAAVHRFEGPDLGDI